MEAHPITSQTDEFQFVEASQTFGYSWLCSSAEDSNKQPKGGYDVFLRFTSAEFRSPEMEYDFHAFRSAGFNIPLMILAICIGALYFVTRANLDTLWFQSNPLFYLGFVSGCFLFTFLTWTILLRLVLISHTTSKLKWLQPYRKSCITFNRSKYSKYILDGVLFALVFTGGFYLLARVTVGACPPHTSIWNSQTCNPFAGVPMWPIEQGMVSMMTIPFFQMFVKGGTYRSICLAWFIAIVMTNIANYLVFSEEYFIWLNMGYLIMMCISYEMERIILVSFINLVLLRKVREERHTMRATIDGNTKDLLANIHIIANVSDDINGSLNSAFANIDILQRKLVHETTINESNSLIARQSNIVHSRVCTSLTTMIHDSLQRVLKSVDDLKVLYKIIEPEALEWQMQDNLRRIISKKGKKRREVVFDGDEMQSDNVHQGSHKKSYGQQQSDDDDDDDDNHGCGEDAELASIHSSKHSSSVHRQPSKQSSLSKRSMNMAAAAGAGAGGGDGSVIHPSSFDRGILGSGINAVGDIFCAFTGGASVGHYSSLTGASVGGRFSSLAGGSPTANIPSPTRPWIKLAKHTLELEDDELIYNNFNEGQRQEEELVQKQEQGGQNGITDNSMKQSDREGTRNGSGNESHKFPSTNEFVNELGFTKILRPIPAAGEGRKGIEILDCRKHDIDQNMNQSIEPFTTQTPFDAKSLFPGFIPVMSSLFSQFESVSSITSPGSASVVVATGKALSSLPSNDKEKLVNNYADNDQFSLDETEEDCRVLSDEIAATLPSPIAVMFPLPSDHMSDGADCDTESKEPTEDSVDDGKMSQYISTMATSIAADILRLRHRKLACILEPSPLQLLVRMQECPYMCDISPYGIIGAVENTRLLDVVDEMSRDDWWVKPMKPTPTLATAATPATTTVFATTDAGTASKGYLRSLIVSANYGFKSIASPFLDINQQPIPNANHTKTMDKKSKRDNNHNDNKLSIGRSLAAPNGTDFMDQLTMAATQSGYRLNAYLMRLSTAFHRDLRSTCDTFELLMHHFDNEEGCCGSMGGNIPKTANGGHSRTNKSQSQSQSQRLLENPQSLALLHEYLVVVRLLLIQTSASLLTTMDNIVIIKAAADAYQKNKKTKKGQQ